MTLEERTAEVTGKVKAMFVALAEHLRDTFPQHAMALSGEVVGTRLTYDRWHRIASVLASLHSIPGVRFAQREHDRRNLALRAIPVATRMAQTSMARDPEFALEFAEWCSDELAEAIRTERETR